MQFRLWLENSLHDVLFIVHPNFAIDNWPHEKNANQLQEYYETVKSWVDNFRGYTVIHCFKPYMLDVASSTNISIYEDFVRWLNTLSGKNKVIWENHLGSSFNNLFDEILLEMPLSSVLYVGGGYLGSCLAKTLTMAEEHYGSYLESNNIKVEMVPELVYVPGCLPHSLHKVPTDAYQLKHTKNQMNNVPARYRWKKMY